MLWHFAVNPLSSYVLVPMSTPTMTADARRARAEAASANLIIASLVIKVGFQIVEREVERHKLHRLLTLLQHLVDTHFPL